MTRQQDAGQAYDALLQICSQQRAESNKTAGSTLQGQAGEQSTLMETTTELLKKLNLSPSREGSKDAKGGSQCRDMPKKVKIQNYDIVPTLAEEDETAMDGLKMVPNRTSEALTYRTAADSLRQSSLSQNLMQALNLKQALRKQ